MRDRKRRQRRTKPLTCLQCREQVARGQEAAKMPLFSGQYLGTLLYTELPYKLTLSCTISYCLYAATFLLFKRR